MTTDRIKSAFLSLMPTDGSTMGNTSLRRSLETLLVTEAVQITEEDYWAAQTVLIEEGFIATGKGRGGSVKLLKLPENGFVLQAPLVKPVEPEKPAKTKASSAAPKVTGGNEPAQIISYRHPDKRVNNPEVGMVNTATDPHEGKNKWAFDPHIDPALQFDPQKAAIESLIDAALASGDNQQMRDALEELKRLQSPYLNWTGKAERTQFEIDTVSLHVHERIDPASILAAVRKAMQGEGKSKGAEKAIQPGLFDAPFESLPLRDAIDFYRHERGWANR
jgi:adenine-specific DNA-methyltransferase